METFFFFFEMPRKVKQVEEEDDGVKIYLPEDLSDEDIEEMEQSQQELEEVSQDEFEQGESKISLSDLPNKSKKELKEIAKIAMDAVDAEPGVVYLGHIPHGFYEEEMQAYFSQFGAVNRLRLSRNKKTGKSKHYAFIEFQSKEVAQIVCDTMDNYLLSNHVLKCKMVPKEKIHPSLFKGAGEKFKALPWNKIQRQKHNRAKTDEEKKLHIEGLHAKDAKKRQKLKELGIDYDFEGHKKRTRPETAEIVSKKPKVEKAAEAITAPAETRSNKKEPKGKVTATKVAKDSAAQKSKKEIAPEPPITRSTTSKAQKTENDETPKNAKVKDSLQKHQETSKMMKEKGASAGSKVKVSKSKTPKAGKKSMK
jgi:nucleolar protein 15